MTTITEAATSSVLAALLRPISFRYPRRLTPVSAWDEHIPFAMTLVALLRPRVFVELGTHAGDSYCAFCQAVEECATETRCYAVDTWRGDQQAGQFGDEVLANLRAHHDPLYGGFSRLIQSTFGEALQYFEGGGVDLLHIDGFHTYEAVRGDFESWLPKMSPRGVILFHDTNVRERNFGVWRLWAELAARYPHFEFAHGHGLGVLAVGDPPEALRPVLDAGEADSAMVRVCFAELGRRLMQDKALRTSAMEQEQLRKDVEHRERDINQLRGTIGTLEAQVAQLRQALTQRNRDVDRILEEHRVADDARQAALAEARSQAEATRETLRDVEQSRAWRALQRYRSLRDIAVPSGSLGRRFYDLALKRRR